MKKLLFLLPLAALVFTGCSPTDGEHTVTFVYDPAGTTKETMENVEVKVKHGETVESPAIPTVKGEFYFNAWYGDEALQTAPFDFDTKIEKDITLYGEWGPWVKAIGYKLTGDLSAAFWDINDTTYLFDRVSNNIYEITVDLYSVQNSFQVTIAGQNWNGQMGFTKVNTEASEPSTSWRAAPGGGDMPNIQVVQDGEYKITVDADNLENPITYKRLGDPKTAAPARYNIVGTWSENTETKTPAFDVLTDNINGTSTVLKPNTDKTKFNLDVQGITFSANDEFLVNKGFNPNAKDTMLGWDDLDDASKLLTTYIEEGDDNEIKVKNNNTILNVIVNTPATGDPTLTVQYLPFYTSKVNFEVNVENLTDITDFDKLLVNGNWFKVGTEASADHTQELETTSTSTITATETPKLFKGSIEVKEGTAVSFDLIAVDDDETNPTTLATVVNTALTTATTTVDNFTFNVGSSDITLKMDVDFETPITNRTGYYAGVLTSHAFITMGVKFTNIPTDTTFVSIRGNYNEWDAYSEKFTGEYGAEKTSTLTFLVNLDKIKNDSKKDEVKFVLYAGKADSQLNNEGSLIKFQVDGKDLVYKPSANITANTNVTLNYTATWEQSGDNWVGKSFTLAS